MVGSTKLIEPDLLSSKAVVKSELDVLPYLQRDHLQ